MKNSILLPTVLLLSASLVGCHSTIRGMGEKQAVGTVMGATAGGLIGSQFGAGGGHVLGTAVGAVVGGIAGSVIGRSIDETDARAANRAYDRSSRAVRGEIVYWENGRTGNAGNIQALRDGHSRYGNYCREYALESRINGRYERVYSTACRRPNGTWYTVDTIQY